MAQVPNLLRSKPLMILAVPERETNDSRNQWKKQTQGAFLWAWILGSTLVFSERHFVGRFIRGQTNQD